MANEIINATTGEVVAVNNTQSMVAFDVTTLDGKKKLFNALQTADSLAESEVSEITGVTGIIIAPAQRTDTLTNELVDCTGVTFIAENGSYFSTSTGIVRCARDLMSALGGGFPEEPITLRFTSRKLSGAKTLKGFEWV